MNSLYQSEVRQPTSSADVGIEADQAEHDDQYYRCKADPSQNNDWKQIEGAHDSPVATCHKTLHPPDRNVSHFAIFSIVQGPRQSQPYLQWIRINRPSAYLAYLH